MIKIYNKGSNLITSYDLFIQGYSINAQGELVANSNRFATENKINVAAADVVEVRCGGAESVRIIYALFDGTTLVSRETGFRNLSVIDVSEGDGLLLSFYLSGGGMLTPEDVPNIELFSSWKEKGYSEMVSETWTAKTPKEYKNGSWS